ncbi:MAG: pyruvate formate lyase family protein, partial [Planctomycetota bacterium]
MARAGIDLGHIAPGWDAILSGGLARVIRDARGRREALGRDSAPEEIAFYESVEIACRAAIALAARFADLAETMAPADPAHEPDLRAIASACRRVPAEPARTFHEALQSMWLMHELIEIEGEHVRSMGHFDRMLYPYYKADVEAGRLTREEAKELMKFLWVRNFARTRGRSVSGKNFLFGGQDARGEPVANDLTFLALEACEELDLPDPKLSVRYCAGSPVELYERVADMIRRNKGSFVLLGDEPAVEALVRRGKTVEDARTYLPIGCYEPAVDGREAACTMNMIVNLAKGVELALGDGVDPAGGERVGPETGDPRQFVSFDQVFDTYAKQMDFVLARAADNIKAHERGWPRVNPSPLIAGTIEDCLERGKDIGRGGARYNAVGCVGVALANAADSLLAIRRAVFDEKRYTMAELLDALAADFESREDMRQYLVNHVPKWGCGEGAADAMARRVADHFCGRVHSFRSERGGPFQASLFSFTFQWQFGKRTLALPDGRRARTPLAPGIGAMTGRDTKGVTAMINSVTKLDFGELPNGSVLDVTLHPSAVGGEEGLAGFVALLRTFFATGGFGIQFNVVDAETLRDAQA